MLLVKSYNFWSRATVRYVTSQKIQFYEFLMNADVLWLFKKWWTDLWGIWNEYLPRLGSAVSTLSNTVSLRCSIFFYYENYPTSPCGEKWNTKHPTNSTFYLNIKVEGVALVYLTIFPHLYFILSYYSFLEWHFIEC